MRTAKLQWATTVLPQLRPLGHGAVRAYTLDLSHFLHTVWERPYVLDAGTDLQGILPHEAGGTAQGVNLGDTSVGGVPLPSILFGSSCYEGDRFRLRPAPGDERAAEEIRKEHKK